MRRVTLPKLDLSRKSCYNNVKCTYFIQFKELDYLTCCCIYDVEEYNRVCCGGGKCGQSCVCNVQRQGPKPDLLCLDRWRHIVAVEVTARGDITDYVEVLRNKCENNSAKHFTQVNRFIVVKNKVSNEDIIYYKARVGCGELVEGVVGEPWFLCS